jgi:putative PIN family toxin of toxin-antitoxin system
MLNIVVDTNQFLSGFIYHGMMKAVFDLVIDNKIILSISPALKVEVSKKLQEFDVSEDVQYEIMSYMKIRGILVEPTIKIEACRDKEDNFALELSETAHADYLVTRDKDLLTLNKWEQTKIITPEEFLPLLRKMKLVA